MGSARITPNIIFIHLLILMLVGSAIKTDDFALLSFYSKDKKIYEQKCMVLSKSSAWGAASTTGKLHLINLSALTNGSMGSPLPISYPSNKDRVAVSLFWDQYSQNIFKEFTVKAVLLIFRGQEQQNNLTLRHLSAVSNSTIIVAIQFNELQKVLEDYSEKPDISIYINRITETSDTDLSVFVLQFLLYTCAIMSILFGSWMTALSREELFGRQKPLALSKSYTKRFILIGSMLVSVVACLLLSYFFYDIVVYITLVLFSLAGILSIVKVLTFFINQAVPVSRKAFALNCGHRYMLKEVKSLHLILFPIALTITITWLIYRNNSSIGWPLQSVIGIFIVVSMLSSALWVSSLKVALLLFTAFTLYDIIFVFITPLFSKTVSLPNSELGLIRNRRSNPISVMEAVATGKAGQSGELMPMAFRFDAFSRQAVLGFGDAFLPGLLCSFLAFYDASWNTPYFRNFWAAITGYTFGFICTFIVIFKMGLAQPALIYLCPFTFCFVVILSLLCDGVAGLNLLWHGAFPVQPSNTTHIMLNTDVTDDLNLHEFPCNDDSSSKVNERHNVHGTITTNTGVPTTDDKCSRSVDVV